MHAIKLYSVDDAQIFLYGKMLKNSVDEDFWFAQEAMKTQVYNLIKTCYRERLQSKLLSDYQKHVEEVLQDRFGLDAWVQNKIVERLFPAKEDHMELKEKLADKLRQKRSLINNLLQKENVSQARQTRSARADFIKTSETIRLAFSEFLLSVLVFQLTKHEEFLDGFL